MPGLGIGVKIPIAKLSDVQVPVLSGVEVGNVADNKIVLTYPEALDETSVAATGDFSFVGSGLPVTISSVGVSGVAVTLTLSGDIYDFEIIKLNYTAGANPIRDLAENNAANLTSQAVTNNGNPSCTLNGDTLDYSNLGLTSVQVDGHIEGLSTCTNCTIDISGTNDHRTAASNDDLNTLLANGNTITLNDVLGAEKITNPSFTLGADLNVNNCVNGAGNPYDTFANATPNGFDATVISGAGVYEAGTPDEISFVSGQKYIVVFDMVLNSGSSPVFRPFTALGGAGISVEGGQPSTAGNNLFVFTANSTTTGVLQFKVFEDTDYEITNLSIKDDDTDWTKGTGWIEHSGLVAYDDATDDTGLIQADGDMVSSIATETVYRAEFKTDATPTTAAMAIKNSAEDVTYFAQANYTDGTHVVYFTTPADVSGAGIAFVAYQSGDAFDLDDVSLKTVTFP